MMKPMSPEVAAYIQDMMDDPQHYIVLDPVRCVSDGSYEIRRVIRIFQVETFPEEQALEKYRELKERKDAYLRKLQQKEQRRTTVAKRSRGKK